MKRKTLLLIFSLFITASLLAACTGAAPASSWSGIAANQDVVYLAYNAHVYAVNITTRQELWRFPAKAQNGITFHAAPVLTSDKQLIAGSYGPGGYNLYSLNPSNGSLNWTFDQAKNHYIASPLVTEEGIYAPNSDGNLYALDLKGNLLWTFKSKKPLWATPATNTQCDCLFVPSMDHTLYALEAKTGAVQWETGDLGGAMVDAPAFSENGTVFIGTFGSELIALSASDGKVEWRYKAGGLIWSQPNLVEGILYFGDSKGALYAVEAANGTEKWKFQVAGPIVATPLIQNGTIYVTEGTDAVYAYQMDGASAWQKKLEGQLQGAVVATQNNLLVSPMNSQTALFVLDESGVQQWAFIPAK